MPQNNYKEFVFCTKCNHYPCYCKKPEVINRYKCPANNYNTTNRNNINNNCSTLQNPYSVNTMCYNKCCKKRPRKQSNKFNKINYSTNNCIISKSNMNSCNSNRKRGFCGLSWLLLFLFFL